MRPVRTAQSNFTYLGPRDDIGDLPCERVQYDDGDRAVFAVYELSNDDRAAIAAGAQLKLGIWNQEPIPPVSLRVADEPPVAGNVERPVPDVPPQHEPRTSQPKAPPSPGPLDPPRPPEHRPVG